MKKQETIIIFGAHFDDEVLSSGGTIKKYSQEGKKIVSVIFHIGGASIPWLKEKLVIKERLKETEKVHKMLGISETICLGIQELKRKGEAEKKDVVERVKTLIKEHKPGKIFCHSRFDTHQDHRFVNAVVLKAVKELDYKGDVYTFDIWNPANIFDIIKKQRPKLCVDISKTFETKLKAIEAYKSQKLYTYQLLPAVHFNARKAATKINAKFAECFEKIR